ASFYGENAETVAAFYERLNRDGVLSDLTPFDIQTLQERFAALDGDMAAKAGIDMAFYDLHGKLLDFPVWRLWGRNPERARASSYTIGIADIDTVRRKTEIALSRGYTILKVKLGSPDDVALFEAVRELAPHPEITLRVDANAAWAVNDALDICHLL